MALPKFLRLTVFSYLPLATLTRTIYLLSKKERQYLYGSGIARSNETLKLKLRGVTSTFFQMEDELYGNVTISDSQLKFFTSLVSSVSIAVRLQPHNTDIKMKRLLECLTDLPTWLDRESISLEIRHENVSNQLDELCKLPESRRNRMAFKSVVIRGLAGSQRQIESHQAMNFLLSKSRRLSLVNTKLDMSQAGEGLEQNSQLKDLNLVNSTFAPPSLRIGQSFPIRLRRFSGADFGFPTESCKQFTENFSSLESLTLDWKRSSSDLIEFMVLNGPSLTSLKHFAYHELSNGP